MYKLSLNYIKFKFHSLNEIRFLIVGQHFLNESSISYMLIKYLNFVVNLSVRCPAFLSRANNGSTRMFKTLTYQVNTFVKFAECCRRQDIFEM